jgi:hypothetical protein
MEGMLGKEEMGVMEGIDADWEAMEWMGAMEEGIGVEDREMTVVMEAMEATLTQRLGPADLTRCA